MKKKGDLQSPITHVVKCNMDAINFEANPLLLRPTEEGNAVRTGEDITLPITHIGRLVAEKKGLSRSKLEIHLSSSNAKDKVKKQSGGESAAANTDTTADFLARGTVRIPMDCC